MGPLSPHAFQSTKLNSGAAICAKRLASHTLRDQLEQFCLLVNIVLAFARYDSIASLNQEISLTPAPITLKVSAQG